MSCYVTFGGYRNRKRITRSVIKWFLDYRKLNRFNTFVHIIDKTLEKEGMYGCIHCIDRLSRPRFFEIEIDNNQSTDDYVTTLIHELIHFEQRLRGTWQQDWYKGQVMNKWKANVVPPHTTYDDEPWDRDAYEREEEYFLVYKENATNH